MFSGFLLRRRFRLRTIVTKSFRGELPFFACVIYVIV